MFNPNANALDPRRAVVAVVIVLAGCGRELMTTPNIYLDSNDRTFDAVPPELQSNTVTMLYATDRTRDAGARTVRYGYGRCPSLAIGEVDVRFGKNVSWDELVAASHTQSRKTKLSVSIARIDETHRFPETPPSVHLEGNRRVPTKDWFNSYKDGERALHAALDKFLEHAPRKEVFMFVHGFANAFDDAAMTMADLWHFLGRGSVPVVYSWPAGRQVSARGYMYDRESGEFTIYHLKQFLKSLAAHSGIEKIHILAHSRGTAVVIATLRELKIEYTASDHDPAELKLGHVILAAADIDFDVAQQRISAENSPEIVDTFTMYSSIHDQALRLSDYLSFGSARAGQVRLEDMPKNLRSTIESMPNNNMIRVTSNRGGLGHSYFHSDPAVSSDLILLLRDDRLPGQEHGRPLRSLAPNFWQLDAGYPNDRWNDDKDSRN